MDHSFLACLFGYTLILDQSGRNLYNSSHSHDSYDSGYDDVYMDGDYDQDRYDRDDDYATGVDDAIEEDIEDGNDGDW